MMVCNRETQHTLQALSLPHHRAVVGQLWFWAVWVVLSVLPSRSSPLFIWNCICSAFRIDYIFVCTRAKHGPERLGAGGGDPTELWGAQSRQKWGRSRPSEGFNRVQVLCLPDSDPGLSPQKGRLGRPRVQCGTTLHASAPACEIPL